MLDSNCIFCKIIQKQIPSTIIAENDFAIVIKDIAPAAPIHYLIIPKVHVQNFVDLDPSHDKYILACTKIIKDVSKSLNGKGFNLVVNNGKDAGQQVFHLHWHYLSGRKLKVEGSDERL